MPKKSGIGRILQTSDGRIRVPELLKIQQPPIFYIVESVDIHGSEVVVKLKLLNVSEHD